MVYIILLFLLFWSLIGSTRLLIILSSRNICVTFIYSILLPINILILRMWSTCYLFWKVGAPTSSLTTFKLAWKTATLLVLVTVKCCSDFTSCIDNQHLFLQSSAAIFIPMYGGKTDHLGHLPPQICIESHSNFNLCLVFSLKTYLRCTESFRMKPDGSHVTSLFLGNNRQCNIN